MRIPSEPGPRRNAMCAIDCVMIRLVTRVGDFEVPNPIICGSGEHVMTVSGIRAALAAGAAGVIAKSVNETAAGREQLDRADYVLLAEDGRQSDWRAGDLARDSLFCRSGIGQLDPDAWFARVADLDAEAAKSGQFVAASIILGGVEAGIELAARAGRSGVRVLEFNVGVPHATEGLPGAITAVTEVDRLRAMVERVKAAAGITVWIKLTGLGENMAALARAARDGGADAAIVMGRFMGLMPDLDTLRPVLGTAAGYGGPWALPITCRWLALSRRETGAEFPLIGTNGARSGHDVARCLLAGASAVEMTSAVLQGGFGVLTAARDELDAWLEDKDLTAAGIIGRAADSAQSYAEQPARPGHWRDFVPVETLGGDA